jgi:hypothetical protein
MRTKAGDRRRTPGGVFFQLAKQALYQHSCHQPQSSEYACVIAMY